MIIVRQPRAIYKNCFFTVKQSGSHDILISTEINRRSVKDKIPYQRIAHSRSVRKHERKRLLYLKEKCEALKNRDLAFPYAMQGPHRSSGGISDLTKAPAERDLKENGGIIMIYDYKIKTGKGETLDLADYKGKVIMVVNTATGCGFTPQYAPIEQLYKDYHDRGLEILDIPCNQFGGQAPGTDDEIHEFCTLHFNTTFPQMKKADVNGPNELPLYTWLKSQKGFEGFGEHQYKALLEKMFSEADPDWDKKPDIKWNFTKFIINREGNVVARFEPTADMADVEACVKSLL